MDEEQKALVAAERGRRAEQLMNDDTLKWAFAELDTKLIERMRGTEDPLTRDALWQSLQILEQVQVVLKRVISNGKMGKADLDRLSQVHGDPRQSSFKIAS